MQMGGCRIEACFHTQRPIFLHCPPELYFQLNRLNNLFGAPKDHSYLFIHRIWGPVRPLASDAPTPRASRGKAATWLLQPKYGSIPHLGEPVRVSPPPFPQGLKTLRSQQISFHRSLSPL